MKVENRTFGRQKHSVLKFVTFRSDYSLAPPDQRGGKAGELPGCILYGGVCGRVGH